MSGLRLLQLLLFKPSSTYYGKAESKANTNITDRVTSYGASANSREEAIGFSFEPDLSGSWSEF